MMTHEKPYWTKLLLAWDALGRTGLTLPFLTGALTITDNTYQPTPEDARRLVREIFDTGIKGKIIKITWCGITKSYGFGIIGQVTNDGMYLDTPAPIYAIDLVCQEFGDLPEEIINGMTDLYAHEISNRTYSITSGKWQVYHEADKEFILAALAAY